MSESEQDKRLDAVAGELSSMLESLGGSLEDFDPDKEYADLISRSEAGEVDFEELRALAGHLDQATIDLLDMPPVPGDFSLCFNDNHSELYLTIRPSIFGGPPVEMEAIRKQLSEMGIAGIDEDALLEAVSKGMTEKVTDRRIAKGEPALAGADGQFELLEHLLDEEAAEEDDFGRHIPQANLAVVEMGTEIGRVTPPRPGIPGRDVLGKEIPAEPGEPFDIKAGENVRFDDETNTFFAECAGRVVIDSGVIRMEKMLEIPEDIDISVGHVHFDGDIHVKGYVKSGLSVKTDGDIVIDGGVEAARVTAENGSIIIAKGVQGSGTGIIQCDYDLTAKFLENVTAIAGGVVEFENAVNSEIVAGESVRAHSAHGAMRGGKIYAGELVELWDCGSSAEPETIIEVGISNDDFHKLVELKEKRSKAEEARKKAEKMVRDIGVTPQKLKSIAGTEEGLRAQKLVKMLFALAQRSRDAEREEEDYRTAMRSRTDGKVHIHGTVYPGVIIRIGGRPYVIEHRTQSATFVYEPRRDRIAKRKLSAKVS